MNNNTLLQTIKDVILESRQRVFRMANAALLQTYWQPGKIIIEDEQQGKAKAISGEATLKTMATQLTQEFGKDLTIVICLICVRLIKHFQFMTHCVTN